MTLASNDVTLQIGFLSVGSTGSAPNGNVFNDADSRNEPGRLGSRDRYRLAAVHRSSTDRGYLFQCIGVSAGRNRDGLDVCVDDRLSEIQSNRVAGRILASGRFFAVRVDTAPCLTGKRSCAYGTICGEMVSVVSEFPKNEIPPGVGR